MENELLQKQLIQLKNELAAARAAYSRYAKWMPLREELDNEIIKIEQELDRKGLDDEKRGLLHAMIKKRGEIDSLLEEGEELSELELQKKERELLVVLWTLYPEKKTPQEQLLLSLEKKKEALSRVEVIHQACTQIHKSLEEAIKIRQKIKRRGLLAYVIGKSPNLSIAEKFYEISLLIEKTIPLLKKYREDSQEIYSELEGKLAQLHKHVTAKWGFKLIDRELTQIHRELLADEQKLVDCREKLERQIVDLDGEIRKFVA